MKRTQSNLFSFSFKKTKSQERKYETETTVSKPTSPTQSVSSTSCTASPRSEENISSKISTGSEHLGENNVINGEQHSIHNGLFNKNDIGVYTDSATISHLSNHDCIKLFDGVWVPPTSYTFPKIINEKSSRTFQRKWLNDFAWLAYSELKGGLFCKYCVIFAHRPYVGKGCHQEVGMLVKTPFTNLKKAIESFKLHEKYNFHRESVNNFENVKAQMTKKTDNVLLQLNKKLKLDVIENRKKIIPMIQIIRICGRQNLSLRGKCDAGRISLTEPENNDGNFRTLLRYTIQVGDETLKSHLQNCGSRNMYTSPSIQNELIDCFGELIKRKIVHRVTETDFYSVLADETADISGIEQLSVCVRYFDEECKELREHFLTFAPAFDLSGDGLSSLLLKKLFELGLNLKNLRGQGYDGAAAMSGKFRGVQAKIREKFPKAIYVHCASHCLNLCLADASKVSLVRTCLGVIKETISFFHLSPKRVHKLKLQLQMDHPESKQTKLQSLCETRWVQRHDAVIMFQETLASIVSALIQLHEEELGETSDKAFTLLSAISQFSFIVTLFVLSMMLSKTYNLSKVLQSQEITLPDTVALIDDIIKICQSLRESPEKNFNTLYEKAKTFAREKLDTSDNLPRTVRLKIARHMAPQSTPEEYYRRNLFIPYLDDFLSSLNERFQLHRETIVALQYAMPQLAISGSFSALKPAVEFYEEDLEYECVVENEFELWQAKWQAAKDVPKSVLEALIICNKTIFPNIYKLLKILAILPATTATSERSFSALRRMKTYIRSTINEKRLDGLALLHIHRDINVTDEEILNEFAKKPRKVNFAL